MSIFKSKKFKMAAVGIIVTIAGHTIPEMDKQALIQATTIIAAYLLGKGYGF